MKTLIEPILPVLFVENDQNIIDHLLPEIIGRHVYIHVVNNLEDALDILKKVKVLMVISDGMFPKTKDTPEGKNFIPLMEEIKKIDSNIRIMPWSNSTHVHEYCQKSNQISYSKIKLTEERFRIKGREYIDVQVLNAKQIADMVEKYLIKKERITEALEDNIFQPYYKEPATVFAMALAADMRTGYFKETTGLNYGPLLVKIGGGVFDVSMEGSSDAKISKIIYEKLLNYNFIEVIERGVKIKSQELLNFDKELREADFSRYSNDQLSDKYQKLYDLLIAMRVYSSLPTAMEHIQNAWTVLLKGILDKKVSDPEEANEVFSTLTSPEKSSYLENFEVELARVNIKILNGEDAQKDIENLTNEYAWINYAFEGIPLTVQDVKDRMAELPKDEAGLNAIITDRDRRFDQLGESKKQIAEKYNFTEKEIEYFKIGAEIVYIKFFRKGVFAESYYSVEFLLREIAKRIGCSEKQVVNMLPSEVLASLEIGSFPCELIGDRLEEGVTVHFDGQSFSLPKSGEKMIKFKKAEAFSGKVLQGQTAYPGIAKGAVRIVNEISDLKDFADGEILVSRSTNPSLISAMKKAAAIVTDTGGLTAHAAIVARELKTPCVVGTKFGTKLFKNGDIAVVDANKGVVTKE